MISKNLLFDFKRRFLALSRTDSLAKSTIKIGCGGLLYGYFGMEQIIMHEERTRI